MDCESDGCAGASCHHRYLFANDCLTSPHHAVPCPYTAYPYCYPNPLGELCARIDCVMQRIFACSQCGCSACCESDAAYGVSQPVAERRETIRRGNPLREEYVEAASSPTRQAEVVMGKPVLVRTAAANQDSRANGQSSRPRRFRPVGATPLGRLTPIPRSVLRAATASATECSSCQARHRASAASAR